MKLRYIKIILLTFFFLTVFFSCQKKGDSNLLLINDLPDSLSEISGITSFDGSPHLYAINDSGNEQVLYKIDSTGKTMQEYKVPNSVNIDWEDLAYDQKTLFIGDFGNNKNDRKDLSIYKVSNLDSENLDVRKVMFYLEDQKKFPPGKKKRNFDIEAFIYRKGYFYLFTKNRSSKFDGTTKVYKVSATEGKQVARLVTSYATCSDYHDCFITGAAINNNGSKIALLTYNKVFILEKFKGDQLFKGTISKLKLNHYSQKEGICFKNDSTLYIVDEKRKGTNSRLYELSIPN